MGDHRDGVDDFVEIPDNDFLSGGVGKSLTIEAWVRLFSLNNEVPVILKLLDRSTKDWGLRITTDGQIQVDIESESDNWNYSAGEVPTGKWTHIAFTFDNAVDMVRIYLNGFEVGEGSVLSKRYA